MTEAEAREYIARNHRAALTTQMQNGRPQLSLVSYAVDDDGIIKMSVTQARAKTRNARRDPRVSLLVLGDNFYQYVVVEGNARIVDDDPIPTLRRVYEKIRGGPHPNWQEFDEAMVRDERCVLCIDVERYYPITT